MRKIFPFAILLLFAFGGCTEEQAEKPEEQAVKGPVIVNVPAFNADSAYHFVEKQVSFGPRVPNTATHDNCAAWLKDKLLQYTPDVRIQSATVKAYDGTPLRIQNIIANLYPEKKRRILLTAHWDTRPFADQDSVDVKKPILGANDGGSGVGVLLEIARVLHENEPGIGITLLLNDAEDYGIPQWDADMEDENTYCLGTQYWAKNLNKNEYIADYAIGLDMVGAPSARFLQEGNSIKYAPQITEKVWKQAAKLGYGNYFIYNRTYPIVDDHYYINTLANIPAIDIVDYDVAQYKKGFGDYWHTHRDNMEIIDRRTLGAVGNTLLAVIFHESQ